MPLICSEILSFALAYIKMWTMDDFAVFYSDIVNVAKYID